MITIYGIKTCGSVKKALAFFKNHNLEVTFIDFKKTPATPENIDHWLTSVSMKTLFNTRGTKYRTLGLSKLTLDESQKRQWLIDENLLIKRPVIEALDGSITIGFDEVLYKERFLS